MFWKKNQKKLDTYANNIIKEQTIPRTTKTVITSVKPTQPTNIEKPNESTILEKIIEIVPIFQKIIPLDCAITVSDKEKILCYLPNKENSLELMTGMAIPKGTAIYEATNTGKVTHIEVPKEVCGVPFKAIAVPIKDEKGNVIGGVGMGISLDTQEKLLKTSQVVATSAHQIAASAEELSSSAEQLAKHQETLRYSAEEVLEQVNNTDAILSFINEVAATSNLLGLNAAIEAARAGEHGRGFSVVAEEIRKMSVSSVNYVKEIKDILVEIKDKITLMSEKIIDTSVISQEQAASTQEITAAIQELASSASKIEEVAKII